MTNNAVSIMGILNCTPDSFFDGGVFSPDDLLAKALTLKREGCQCLDIGGESTRPGAHPVTLEEELERVIPVIKKIRQISSMAISVDTTKSEVARQALKEGVQMINDVSGLTFDKQMADVVAESGCQVVIMHSRGNSQNMNQLTQYTSFMEEVVDELQCRIDLALRQGVQKKQIWVDPGFGFAKTTQQNWDLLHHLEKIKKMGYPLLVALSRKKFLSKETEPASERLQQTLAANLTAIQKGADMIRVHDVAAHVTLLQGRQKGNTP